MEKIELPKMLHIPGINLPNGQLIYIQIQDEDENMAILAWSNSQKAISWLDAGGFDLWKRNDSAFETKLRMGGTVVINKSEKIEFFELMNMIGEPPKRYLQFEPEQGSFFSPIERRVHIK